MVQPGNAQVAVLTEASVMAATIVSFFHYVK